MDSDTKFYSLIWVLCAVLALALMGTLLYSCERCEDRRTSCIDRGHSPVECRELFKFGGD